ncbi:MAG: 16S rRNA (adenine(1518)-N(6)/adenine(1519)-N(6))-dimethyltransferase RsmA [Acidimicrobiales bacterium]|jgi:16S rRNA (adenine1518-N6/adenine1519-N6)-dimethyltransferase
MTLTRTEVRELLDRYQISPKRSLGQNFVVEPNTVRRIAELAEVGPGDQVVEIGPGIGALTLALCDTGASVTAIEIDDTLVEVLNEVTNGRSVRIVHADAMKADWTKILGAGPWHLVANLPYNISVPLICDLLDETPAVVSMLVMVQREVADRLVAGPGDAAYGLPSVKVNYHATAALVGKVPPSVFYPRPRVDSALVHIKRRLEPAVTADAKTLFALVRAGFGQRRKMLRRSLSAMITEEEIKAANVEPTARAEELNLQQWAAIADRVKK